MRSDDEILDIWKNRSYEYCKLDVDEKIRLIGLLDNKNERYNNRYKN